MTSRVFQAAIATAALAIASLPLSGCAAAGRPGEASGYVMVESMQAASGAEPTRFGGTLPSDVQTYVNATVNGVQVRVPTVFEDVAQVTFRLAMKNPTVVTSPANFVTFMRYRVAFRRSDGRKAEGKPDAPARDDGILSACGF